MYEFLVAFETCDTEELLNAAYLLPGIQHHVVVHEILYRMVYDC